jgi:hypothetical protein
VSHSDPRLLAALEAAGVLLLQDKALPCVVTLVTGERVSGSWWAHPRSHEVFRRAGELAEHRDVLVTKLVAGKVTFVHRRLWPAVLAVATAHERWQSAGLSQPARALWKRVETTGGVVAAGAAAKEVERRLLVHGEQIHTEAGRHGIRLEPWNVWALRSGCGKTDRPAANGRTELEGVIAAVGGSPRCLPWHVFR